MSMISYKDFEKMDLRTAQILNAQAVEGAEHLIKLDLDIGDEHRVTMAGIAPYYKPEDLIGKNVVMVANLEPKQIFGVESRGMILAAVQDDKPVLIQPDKDVPPGTLVC